MAMRSEIKKAIILAAGMGTRLEPLTLHTPKVLLKIGNKPLVLHILDWMKSHGIDEIVINLHHHGEMISNLLGDGSSLGLQISYSVEEELLGTSGAVRKVEHFFDGPFLVYYGDNLTNFNLHPMIEFHRNKKALATINVFESNNPGEVGVLQMDGTGRIISLQEKPAGSITNVHQAALANGGVYLLEKEVFDYIPTKGFSDFCYDVFPKIIQQNSTLYGYVLNPNDYLIDIGTPDKYNKANSDIITGKVKLVGDE